MSKRTRRHHTTDQKVTLLKRHLVDKVPVSDLCDENGLQPSLFYGWQRQLFGAVAQRACDKVAVFEPEPPGAS